MQIGVGNMSWTRESVRIHRMSRHIQLFDVIIVRVFLLPLFILGLENTAVIDGAINTRKNLGMKQNMSDTAILLMRLLYPLLPKDSTKTVIVTWGISAKIS